MPLTVAWAQPWRKPLMPSMACWAEDSWPLMPSMYFWSLFEGYWAMMFWASVGSVDDAWACWSATTFSILPSLVYSPPVPVHGIVKAASCVVARPIYAAAALDRRP